MQTVQEVWDSPQRFSSGTSTVGFTTESGSCILVYVHWYPFHANGALSGEKSHPIHHEGAAGASPKSLGRKMRESVRGFASKMKSASNLDLRRISGKAGNGPYFPVCHSAGECRWW